MNPRISPTEVPAKFLHQTGANKGALNQSMLRLDRDDLVCGEEHPLCSNIVFQQYDRKADRQQWNTRSRHEWRKARTTRSALAYYYKKKAAKKAAK